MSALFRSAKTTDFDRLYRRHAASVYRYAYAVLGRRADAEDITQQTFLNAYRAIERGTRPRKAENWLLTIAHNELRRHFRTTLGRPLEVELDDEIAQPVPERSDPSVADIVRALQQLPPAQRSALVMREFEGRPYAEVAEIMGVSQSALEALLFRARRSLAEELEDGLTCAEAERALSLRLDGRLKLRERRRLRAHLRECPLCARFERVQKRQRSQLGGLSVMPIPASLVLVRGESAAAALGLGTTAAATGGSTAAVAGGAGATGIVSGLVAKAAAITAAATVAGGVGYGVAAGPAGPVAKAGPAAKHAPVAARARPSVLRSQVAASPVPSVRFTKVRAKQPQSPPSTKPKKAMPARPRRHAKKAKPVKVSKVVTVTARAHRQSAPKVKTRPTKPVTTRPAVAKAPSRRKIVRPAKPARLKPPRPAAARTKPKPAQPKPAQPGPAQPAKDSPPVADAPGRVKNEEPPGR
jgi:RNA polymerase sigma factor (sigma-70 family)